MPCYVSDTSVAHQHAPEHSPLATVVEGVINNLGQQLATCFASTIRLLLFTILYHAMNGLFGQAACPP
jgi:succinate dehydrogenase hydrophobic anchor subunit